jgi:CRISPR-associated endonuclease Cas1
MQSHVSATFRSLACNGGVCIADGYGIQVRVRNRCLVVSDGIGRFRRERVFAKALADIRRLVIIGHEGAISLEALRWLSDARIDFLQIDRDGKPIFGSAEFGLNDPRLRRAQALARDNRSGLEITRYLLSEKLAGQAKVLARPGFPENAATPLSALSENARNAFSLPELLTAEATGAAAYWSAWYRVAVRFAKKDEKRIPAHWKSFGQRSSPITGSPRLAASPANAMLNYLYALLEQESRLACLACGLDPGLGIFHADQPTRDSLALDLMEAVRPQVDAYLLDLLNARIFGGKDFVETRRGVCRVLAPVTHTLAETTITWAAAVAPVVEHVCKTLARRNSGNSRLPTPLTQTNRRTGRDGVRRNAQKAGESAQAHIEATCPRCGGVLPNRERLFCDDCYSEYQDEQLGLLEKVGPAALARLRNEGRDPRQTAEAQVKRKQTNSCRRRETVAWNTEHERPDPEVFTREILPGIQGVSLSHLMKATGLSLRYCSRIRRGYVPHPKHWKALSGCALNAAGAGGPGL